MIHYKNQAKGTLKQYLSIKYKHYLSMITYIIGILIGVRLYEVKENVTDISLTQIMQNVIYLKSHFT